MRNKYKVCLISCVLSVFLLGGCTAADTADKTESSTEKTTENTLPSAEDKLSVPVVFQAQDIEGNDVSSAVFSESKLTMINVWATYCNPCLNEMPGLGRLAGEYNTEDFQVIGVISDVQEGADQETIELAKNLIGQTEADYPHLLLNESLYHAFLTDVTAVPTTFFFNEKGMLLDTVVGSMEKSAWEEKISELLEEL